MENKDLPSSRAEAVRLGSTYYFTGRPCNHGHIDKRRVSGGCYTCWRRTMAGRDRATGFSKAVCEAVETDAQKAARLQAEFGNLSREFHRAQSELQEARSEVDYLKRRVRDLEHDVVRYRDG